MVFSFKNPQQSKCDGCALAHSITTFRNTDVTICQRIGMAVRDVKTCNNFLSHMHAPVPMHIAMNAWMVDPDKKSGGKVGFAPPSKTVVVSDPISQEVIGPIDPDEDDE